ncbi:hypothetical protein BRAS3843_510009 [Bradyrhizobium sp. STM 3843]|nr:hypothetical protein BRAS3843_510009 [Bradyrhizobium sp. STM 3843]
MITSRFALVGGNEKVVADSTPIGGAFEAPTMPRLAANRKDGRSLQSDSPVGRPKGAA